MQQPSHPTSQLTTYELRNYRRELEHALKTLPDHATARATARAQLQSKLAEVVAEQESRSQAAKMPHRP